MKNDIVILGRPRSGNNWIRYICQHLRPDITVHKTHFLKPDDYNKDTKLIVPVRNYKECLIRHFYGSSPTQEFSAYIDGLLGEGHADVLQYMEYLLLFEKYSGDKTLIYYEDLIQNPKMNILKLNLFIGGEQDDFVKFMDNFEDHKTDSLTQYVHGGSNVSITGGDKVDHHKYHIPLEDRQMWDQKLEQHDPYLYETYLTRYKEDE